MKIRITLVAIIVAVSAHEARAQVPLGVTMQSGGFLSDSVRPRPRAKSIQYSDWYYRRLLVHRYASYAMVPLFATQWYLGEQLGEGGETENEDLRSGGDDGGNKDLHAAVGTAIGVVFVVNTVTGAWNLWDSRKDPDGRTKRIVHSVLMTAADAGIAIALGGADDDGGEADDHKNIALASMGIATVGGALMWFWR